MVESRRKRALVVDDSDIFRGFLVTVLTSHDFEVVATVLAEAVEPQELYDLVCLPGHGGVELVPLIHELHPETVVIVCSGDDAYKTRALEAGADAFALKGQSDFLATLHDTRPARRRTSRRRPRVARREERSMPEVGAPGTSTSNAEPPPQETVWLVNVSGYRIGVLPARKALVVEVLDYRPGYLLITKQEIDALLTEQVGLRQGKAVKPVRKQPARKATHQKATRAKSRTK